jgi:hypothetical protein
MILVIMRFGDTESEEVDNGHLKSVKGKIQDLRFKSIEFSCPLDVSNQSNQGKYWICTNPYRLYEL